MRCPICGWVGAGNLHIAGHTLANRRMKEGAMPTAPGGNWRPIPTARELAALAGYAIEAGQIESVNRRWVKEE